jgi:hypothetical protein
VVVSARQFRAHFGQSEVADLGRAVGGQQDVGRLEVAVQHPLVMRRLHRPRQRLDQPGRLRRRQRCAVQLPVQRAARAQFQREEGPTVVFADLVDLHDVGMGQPGDGLGLVAKAAQVFGVLAAGADHLEGDEAVGALLAGPVDDAHPALAQDAQHLIARHARRLDARRRRFAACGHGVRRVGGCRAGAGVARQRAAHRAR